MSQQFENISELLSKPLWQMTGAEFVTLQAYAFSTNGNPQADNITQTQCVGVKELASHLSCSESQIHKLLREGVLDPSIVSRIGKRIVFDSKKAMYCASEYKPLKYHTRKHNEN